MRWSSEVRSFWSAARARVVARREVVGAGGWVVGSPAWGRGGTCGAGCALGRVRRSWYAPCASVRVEQSVACSACAGSVAAPLCCRWSPTPALSRQLGRRGCRVGVLQEALFLAQRLPLPEPLDHAVQAGQGIGAQRALGGG